MLDFQDAVCGPITYDLVSLLRDCYVAWPAERSARVGLAVSGRAARKRASTPARRGRSSCAGST